jgi:hypothetical protein
MNGDIKLGYWILDTGYWILDFSVLIVPALKLSSIQYPVSSIHFAQ